MKGASRSRIFVALAMMIFLVSAAWAGGTQGSTASSGSQTITWWALAQGGAGEDPRQAFRERVIAAFEAANPGVTVELTMLDNEAFKQRIQATIQAGDPPDIFHSWGGGVMVEYAKAGMLRDITSFVNSNLADDIGAGQLGVYGYDGKYYGAPYDLGAVGFWYSKSALAEAGISQFPRTWAELLAAVPKLKAAGYIPIALGAGDKWPAHFWWVYLATRLGGQAAFNAAYSGAGAFTDRPFVQAGELLLQLRDLDPFQTGYLGATYDDESALVGNGEAAMELMGQWAPGAQASGSVSGNGIGDDLAWAPFPSVAGGRGLPTDVLGGGNGYVIGKDAPDVALAFLEFFLQEQYNAELVGIEGIVPVVKGAESALEGNANATAIAQAVANAGYYQLYYDQYLPPAVGAAVNDAVAALLAGQLTPAQAAAAIDASWKANM